jgi:hypothetical protein
MHTIPEIRFDHMTDRALLDPESTAGLHALSARWAERSRRAADEFRPLRPSVQAAWEAMARLRARALFEPRDWSFDLLATAPFPLVQVRKPAFGTWTARPGTELSR